MTDAPHCIQRSRVQRLDCSHTSILEINYFKMDQMNQFTYSYACGDV